jgi:hypothetical protein
MRAPLRAPRVASVGNDPAAHFGSGRLLLADSRFAFAVVNRGRRWAIARVFGLTGPQADMLSFVLALGAVEATLEGLRRAIAKPFGLTGPDAVMGAFTLREGTLAIAGPAAREAPGFAALVMLAVIGGVGLPGLRRARHNLRVLERRVRSERIRRYREALEAARAVAGAQASPPRSST